MADDRPAGTIGDGNPRYPGLDLLRALAIVLVVNCHAATAFGSLPEYRVLQLGGKGVDLFFVLSGWLLGRQLMRELRDTGGIDLRRFWYRRWLRTLPAYYAVLALTYVWQLAKGNYDLRWSYLYFGQTYLTDLPYFGVSWSLCVEEHFYLLVAPTLLVMWRWPWARLLAVPLLVLPVTCRAFGWYFTDFGVETHARYDPCAVGVLLAVVNVARPRVWAWLRRLAPVLAVAGFVAAGRDVVCRLNPSWGLHDQGILAWALIFGSWVLLAAARPNWAVGRLRGVRHVAERSYAIYLLHVEALLVVRQLGELPFAVFVLLTWVISLVLAEILYRLVELPGMQLRERFSASRTREAPPREAVAPPTRPGA